MINIKFKYSGRYVDEFWNNRQEVTSLTHWGQDKMAAIFQTTVSNGFSLMKMYEFRLKFHWSLFPRVQLTIFQHWFRKWLGAVQATSHYLNQWWLVYRRIYASLGLNELKMFKCIPVHGLISTYTLRSYFFDSNETSQNRVHLGDK